MITDDLRVRGGAFAKKNPPSKFCRDPRGKRSTTISPTPGSTDYVRHGKSLGLGASDRTAGKKVGNAKAFS